MTDTYQPLDSRYTTMPYQTVGHSGLKLPRFSLGLWHNFGQNANAADARALITAYMGAQPMRGDEPDSFPDVLVC